MINQEMNISFDFIKDNCDTIADIIKLVDDVRGTNESQ